MSILSLNDFLVIKGENGQLRRADAKRIMPTQIKYEVLTPTKVVFLTVTNHNEKKLPKLIKNDM